MCTYIYIYIYLYPSLEGAILCESKQPEAYCSLHPCVVSSLLTALTDSRCACNATCSFAVVRNKYARTFEILKFCFYGMHAERVWHLACLGARACPHSANGRVMSDSRIRRTMFVLMQMLSCTRLVPHSNSVQSACKSSSLFQFFQKNPGALHLWTGPSWHTIRGSDGFHSPKMRCELQLYQLCALL